MKARLREPVKFDGIMTNYVELATFDWTRRIAFLPDGRWVPMEAVSIGDPFPDEDQFAGLRFGMTKAEDEALATNASCDRCGRSVPRKSLGGHKRHCKGEP